MANELTKKEEDLISTIKGTELGDVIKPLIKEIHLFDSYVAGTTHLDDATVLDTIKEGDWLFLQREDNKFDMYGTNIKSITAKTTNKYLLLCGKYEYNK